jgi:hypothetical protein
MDSLFNSHKLFGAWYQAQASEHCVARTNSRSLPLSIIQKEEKNVAQAKLHRGITKAARMVDCRDCPNLLAVSVYDTKPVHLLLTASDCVEWNVMQKKVWSKKAKKKSFVKFLHLNMIDDYNHNMDLVDLADQLWGVYHPDHWMQNMKWWWAIWIWGIEVAWNKCIQDV